MPEFTNYRLDGEITGYSPDIAADYAYPADFDRTYNYMMELFHMLVKGMSDSNNNYIILRGGDVTDAGEGKINISECWAVGDDAAGKKKLLFMPARSGLSLPAGFNDNRQIWVKLKYAEKRGTETRTHWNGETYHHTCFDSYVGETSSDDLFTDANPMGAAVVLGSFKMNGTAFSAQTGRSDEYLHRFSNLLDDHKNAAVLDHPDKSVTMGKLEQPVQDVLNSVTTLSSQTDSFLPNGNFEIDANSWNVYADTAGSSPVDGTGGTANLTIARNTTSPLFGAGDAILSKDAVNRQGQGWSTDFTVPNGCKGQPLDILIDAYFTSANYQSGDIKVYIYDKTNNQLIFPNVVDLPASTSVTSFASKFWANTNSTLYRLVLHVSSTNASAWTVNLDNIAVRRNKIIQAGAMSDWVSYTPTLTNVSISSASGRWKRNGDSMHVFLSFTMSGAAPTNSVIANIPNGYIIDTAKLPNILTDGMALGTFRIRDVGGSSLWYNKTGTVVYNNTTGVAFQINAAATVMDSDDPGQIESGDYLTAEFLVPISGWSSNIQLVTPSISPDKAGFLQMSCGSAGAGWSLADGSTYNIKDYPDLHTNVGYSFLDITDICSGGTAISGGDYSTNVKANAFNNDYFTSIWSSTQNSMNQQNNAYIGYDFGSGNTKHIRHLRWLTYSFPDGTQNRDVANISSVRVEFSDDNSVWTSVQGRTGTNSFATSISVPTTPGVFITLELAATGSHRYWRLIANTNISVTGIGWVVCELEMSELSPTSNFIDLRGVFPVGAGTTDRVDGKDIAGNFYSKQMAQYYKDSVLRHRHSTERLVTSYPGTTVAMPAGSADDRGVINVGDPIASSGLELRTGNENMVAAVGVNFYVKLYNDTVPAVELPTVVHARYNITSQQNIGPSYGNVVNFNNKVKDTHNAVTTGTNWRFVVPISGVYAIDAKVTCFTSATNMIYGQVDMRNSSDAIYDSAQIGYGVNGSACIGGGTIHVYLNAGDKINYSVAINGDGSGSSVIDNNHSQYNWISITRIGS